MAKGKAIVLTVEAKGYRVEGLADSALLPGMVARIKAATEPVGGRHTLAGSATQANIVITEDHLQGKTNTDAYTSGGRCFGYVPLPGDEFNALFLASEGAQAIGDEVGPNAAGKFVGTGTGYEVLETITVGGSDTLVHVRKV